MVEAARDARLAEQRAFYVADAVDFDAFLRSLEDPANDAPVAVSFRAGRRGVQAFLAAHAPLGDVLDIAAGNGILSELVLAAGAARVTLLDAAETSLEFAATRLDGLGSFEVVVDDVFTWRGGGRRFDTIVFSSWLHHVPRADLPRFWDGIDGLLAPGGQVLFDFPRAETAVTAALDELPDEPTEAYSLYQPANGTSIRDHNGARWTVVHELWERDDLVAELAAVGWTPTASAPGWWEQFEWLRVVRA